ncbi:hypothetical protein AOL_s00080g381 [Orbilia oligospora ATCC 24927]|uniref:NAD-dependent epimerase/dehydratase domain-containing protein n=1 Tax=Arthrobotrys oligospora (strain ATCC 24927 / CBS 115.81 / DSM 1491) TaxID=756982 RepID=G1XEZ6_ARTOA|nr:hypothetical protein AOL_s00080g381 [Orbilia oligospora ATCC 24927]EGX48256.1 hypothetical protein AOL_s00080g381 [Orbilia oligospora ATCC 24927]
MDSRFDKGDVMPVLSLRAHWFGLTSLVRQHIYLATVNPFHENGLSSAENPLANWTSSPRPTPWWHERYHKRLIKQVINLLTSLPCYLYEPFGGARNPVVLVTSGLGYVGSHVCIELLRKGYTILIVDDLTNSFGSVVQDIRLTLEASGLGNLPSRRLIHIPIDYGDPISLDRALVFYSRYLRVTGVIHLAASKSVAESLKNPWKYYENNVIKMERFLRVLGKHGIRNVVFSSSATAYGCLPSEMASKALNEDMVPIIGLDVDIKDTTAGLTPYGISKIFGEAMIKKFVDDHPRRRAVVFRLFNPVGSDPSSYLKENPRDYQWCVGGVMQMIKKAVVDDTVFQVFGGSGDGGDGSCIRDFVHVGDIARGFVMGFEDCLRADETKKRCKVYNLASGKGVSVKQLLKEVENESGAIVKIEDCQKRREGDVPISIGDMEKVRNDLGWRPEARLTDICKHFCRAYGIGKYAGEGSYSRN